MSCAGAWMAYGAGMLEMVGGLAATPETAGFGVIAVVGGCLNAESAADSLREQNCL